MSSTRKQPLTVFGKHFTVFLLVALWTLPTLGLLISSVRDKDQLTESGWWTSMSSTDLTDAYRTPEAQAQESVDGQFVITDSIFEQSQGQRVKSWSLSPRDLGAYGPGETVTLDNGSEMTLQEDGTLRWTNSEAFEHSRGERVFYTAAVPPRFTLDNYAEVLEAEGIGRAFINTMTVTLPATFIPILIAAFAAYALAWMKFPGRLWILALIVGLLVVPLQISLIPVLRMYTNLGNTFGIEPKSYPGIWLAHTAFGLSLAVYLLRNYMSGLPKEVMESARMDGASHFDVFRTIVLPLSVPALASFAIFQFLWVWNDLLVALVFLGKGEGKTVMTAQLVELLGSRGDNWEILTAGAFITIIVPLIVFISMQRFFVRGMLAGSVKGG
ncbi:carbohydrate ABC transporter permease [Saccharospirillum salsuginis]|uniref:Alpha-glucoside transport system permease protein AglG n=1 Tax=Saccharospirillum salsuginis TaxID=418750 RepID=A0A918NCS2_9GAMM|nr:carbohydrate ABC transporter permease [Saccharospirillum salsuginis]GGX58719.1 alpha-glucoside transport system permease protein AglG [Saccharospirillum salsuginis]